MNKTTSLATIPAVESVIKPRPTKGEILTAMAMLHIEQCQKQNTETSERRKKLETRIGEMMLELVRNNKFRSEKSYPSFGHRFSDKKVCGAHLNIDFDLSECKELHTLLKEYHDCQDAGKVKVPSLQEARKMLRDRIEQRAGTEKRVAMLLLKGSDSRKALEDSLEAIS